MYILTQFNTIVNFDKYEKIDIIAENYKSKWEIYAVKNSLNSRTIIDGEPLGEFEHYTDAINILIDMAKKIELGRAVYVMPMEVNNDK